MQFSLDTNPNGISIQSYDDGRLTIGGAQYAHSVIVTGQAVMECPISDFDGLGDFDFNRLAEHAPELVILGTGVKQRFPPPAWLAPLYSCHIGVECMTTAAACRTFNILVSEGRRVTAVLLLS